MNSNSLQLVLEKIKSDQDKTKKNDKHHITKKKDTVLIGSHFNPKVQKQLKILSAEEDKTHHLLLSEALDLLFAKYGKKEISRLLD